MMLTRSAVCLVFALLFVALPLPQAEARAACALVKQAVHYTSGGDVDVSPGRNWPWPHGPVWADAPWSQAVNWDAEVGYQDGCLYAGAGLVFLGNEVDPFAAPGARSTGQSDGDSDGMGDVWAAAWGIVNAAVDTDEDGLLNVDEFRWQLVPVCLGVKNCKDHESNTTTGKDGDGWRDGAEVAYWDNPHNNHVDVPGLAFFDPDRLLDSDGDGVRNVNETDSDDDGLSDGQEISNGTYPEFKDSDCELFAVQCTEPQDTTYWDQDRLGKPGTGDHINDFDERAYWDAVGPGAWLTDFDGDGIANNLLDPDSDGDGVLDGDEIAAGTKPWEYGDGPDGTVGEAAANSPTNENLPEELMDPTNLQYLQEGRADATAQANETAEVVDQLISAAIAGNVTQALNVLYNYTPVAAPLRSATQIVQVSHEAVLGLVKCASGMPATQGLIEPAAGLLPASETAAGQYANNVYDPTALLALADEAIGATNATALQLLAFLQPPPDPTAITEDPGSFANATITQTDGAVACMSQVLRPFLEALLDRALEDVPLVSDLVANVRNETLPGIVETADAIAPVALQATTQGLLTRPVESATRTILSLPGILTDPAAIGSAITDTEATTQVAVSELLKPSGRHPQMLYDLATSHSLQEQWALVAEQNSALGESSGGRADAIATVDSLSFNLYTNRAGSETVTAMPVGQRTCIQLDATATTRDSAGCDLYALLAVGSTTAPTSASPGTRLQPSLTIEKAVPAAAFALEALGYLQLPNAPYIVVLGYNSTIDGIGHDAPDSWEATLNDYDPMETDDRSISLTTSHRDTRSTLPLLVLAGAFRVDENTPGKPVDGTNETLIEATSLTMASRFGIDIQRDDTSGERILIGVASAATMDVVVAYRDVIDDTNATMILGASLPLGSSNAVAEFAPDRLGWTWTSTGQLASLDLGYLEQVDDEATQAFQVNATDLPRSLSLSSDKTTHLHRFQADAAPATFRFIVAHNSAACPSLDVGAEYHANFDYTADHACMTGRLDGYTQAQLQSSGLLAQATGKRTTPSTQGTALQAQDGNVVFFNADDSPASWDGQLSLLGNRSQDLQWTASSTSSALKFNADLDQGARHELMKADLTLAPTRVQATLDLTTGQGTLSASDYIGTAKLALTTTGNAPSAPASGDHARIHILPGTVEAPDVESSWSTTGVRSLVARVAPNGTFEVTGDYQALQPLNVIYQDDSHDLALDVSGLTGQFGYWLTTNSEAGILEFRQAASNAPATVHLVGRTPGGRIDIESSDLPARFSVAANLRNETVELATTGIIGHLNARYATGTEAPDLPAGNAIVMQDATTGERGVSLNLDGTGPFKLTRLPDRLTLDSSFTTTQTLTIHVEDATGAVELLLHETPAHVDVQFPEGGFAWVATSPTSFSFDSVLDVGPRFVSANATDAPPQLTASWTPRFIDSFNATITHNGANPIDFDLQDFRGDATTTGAGWNLHADDLPARAMLRFNPSAGNATATFRSSLGMGASVGQLEAAFTSGGTLPDLDDVQGLWMQDDSQVASGALSVQGARRILAHLFDATGSRLTIDRVADGTFAVRAASARLGAEYILEIGNAPARVQLEANGGTTAAEGLKFASSASGAAAATSLRLTREQGPDVAFSTPALPPWLNVSWNAASPIQLTASAPTTLGLQYADELATAPWQAGDFVAIQWTQDTTPRMGLHLTGLSNLTADPLGRQLQATGDTTVAPFLLDYQDPAQRLAMQASDLGPAQRLAWDNALRSFEHDNTAPIDLMRLQATPASESSPRLMFGMDEAPSGLTAFSQGVGFQSFAATATAPLGRLWVSADQGGSGAMQILDEAGVFLDASVSGKPFQLDLPNVQDAEGNLNPGAAAFAQIDSTGAATPVRLRLNGAHQLTATINSLPSGVATLEWPNPVADVARFGATGVSGTTLQMGAVLGQDHAQVHVTDSPASWNVTATPSGSLDYVATSQSSVLSASGLFHGAAWDIQATGVPDQIHVVPAAGMQTGAITATGSGVGHLVLALAPSGSGASGQLPRPTATGMDLFTIDATSGPGMLFLDLPGVKTASWQIPDAASATASTLSFTADLSSGTARPAVLQAVHPAHQTRIDLPQGMPAQMAVTLQRSLSQWNLEPTLGGRIARVQHEDANAGSLNALVSGAGALTVAPKANRALDWNGAASPSLGVQSRWNNGYVSASLEGVPAQFAIDANALLPGPGSISTLDSGAVGKADVLVVPDASSTVNRVVTPGDHVAVELMGKVPYAAVDAHGFEEFQWTLPLTGTQTPVSAILQRSQSVAGETLVVLSGPREDVTATLEDPAAIVGLSVYQSTNAPGTTNPEPVRVSYTSTGGTTNRVDVTHVDADSGQLLTSHIEDASGTTNLVASGAEPAFIDITATGSQGGISFQTTDLGTGLNLNVQDLSSRLTAIMARATCGATFAANLAITTQGTGQAGRTLVQIGDYSSVPSGSGDYVDFRCNGNSATAAVNVPFVEDFSVSEGPCSGLTVTGIPANGPMPLYFADTRGLYNIQLESSTPGGGFLTLTLDCDSVEYQFDGILQPASLDKLAFGYTLLKAVNQVTNECLDMGGVCVLTMNVTGTDMPSTAAVTFTTGNDESSVSIMGAHGGNLDIGIVVEPGAAPKNTTRVRSTMPLDGLRYLKTTQDAANLPQLAPNQIVQLQTDSEATLYVTLEKPTSLEATIETGDDCYLRVQAEYSGNSGSAFEFFKKDPQNTQRASVSNLPDQFNVEILNNGFGEKYASATTSEAISSLRYVTGFSTGCDKDPMDADLYATLTDIPAGSFTAGWMFGAAGFIKANSDNGFIGTLDVGLAVPGNANRYTSLHLDNARLALEWDFDGDSRYEGSPRYIYCDTGGGYSKLSLRSRYDAFGAGISGNGGVVDLICNAFQLRYEPKVLEFPKPCLTSCGGTAEIAIPWFKTAGKVGVPIELPYPLIEVLVNGKWWAVPNKLVIG